MSVFIGVMIVVIATFIIKSVTDKDSRKESLDVKQPETEQKDTGVSENMQLTTDGVQIELGARDLLMRVLMQMGCQYMVDENQKIQFVFQGERFLANATNDKPYIVIIDPWWLTCELQDVEHVVRIKNAINEANCVTSVNTYYHIHDETKQLAVHSDKSILFIPQIPEIENYLRAVLDMFFSSHRRMLLEVDRQKNS